MAFLAANWYWLLIVGCIVTVVAIALHFRMLNTLRVSDSNASILTRFSALFIVFMAGVTSFVLGVIGLFN